MLEQDFLAFINGKELVEPTGRVLLAVSGGLDSMVMARLFHRAGQSFAIAHVNFGLRGDESEADALFVANKAAEYGVPFHLTHFDTTAIAAQSNVSIQMAARQLRYAWFNELLINHHYVSIATAHHQNDVLETVLLNLTRGTGLAGLHGIAVRQGDLIRPMLFATREQLTVYAEEQHVTYREDSSNQSDKYARNRIRHHVVPVLTSLNPSLWYTWPRTVEKLRAAEKLVQEELNRSWQQLVIVENERVWLPLDKLTGVSEVAFRLGEWLKPFGFTADQVTQLVATFQKPAGQVFQSATHRIVHERSGLLLEPLSDRNDFAIVLDSYPNQLVTLPGDVTLQFELFEKPADFHPPTNSAVAYLDADKLTFPLTIRPWQQGDRFHPLGLKGSKLVSDLLNDLKVSRSERSNTNVLLSKGAIVWVIGRRISHLFRVTDDTCRIIKVQYQ
ncbi:tRNA lysidine(34) synthetase TilS [Spirosoma sp. BT702]|uniref:tRNA(Ile)-lysidine synthase n=1 Tax=Spirosoma profusum TaxID=2771354 RepID=A0A926XYR7_9BACT|nr:tRNA lysidine(34) synthetase TilS [Spirosoma profusum]MBD2703252.1 tRNA lysidine(34) synthetase TilS [Spirosoma profusum]